MRVIPRKTNLRLLARHPLIFMRVYLSSLIVLLLGALADALSTYQVVQRYGAEAEVHPAQRLVLHLCGPALGVPLAKGVQLLFVVVVACWWRPWCRWILVVCGMLYALAALSNHFHWL